ncbi:ABC transporter ATP-binding protein [Candidatus Uhrbacteria bacterium]|nr:ABC transporter ATP-binding protein [Candidatus Uhrbacteria bacterium]
MDADSVNWKDYHKGSREIYEVYRWIWKDLMGVESRKLMRPIVIFMALSNALAMTVPWILGRLIDQARAQNGTMMILLIAGFHLIKVLHKHCGYRVGCARELFFGASRGSVDKAINRLFFEKSLGQMLQDHDRLSAANLNKGRGQLYQIMDLLLFEGIETALLLLMSFACLWILSPLSGAIVTLIVTIFGIWSRGLHRKLAVTCVPIDIDLRKLDRHREEIWDKNEKPKTNAKEPAEIEYMSDEFQRILTMDRSFWLWYIKQLFKRDLVNDLALTAILAITSLYLKNGTWNIGLFIAVSSWSSLMIDNLHRLSRLEQRVSWSYPPVNSMKETLTMKPDIVDKPNAIELDVSDGVHVEISHVTHAYPRHDGEVGEPRPVLSDVTFAIERGEVVGLIGPSGTGKSTLMRLLQRGMDPTEGMIAINGHDLRDVQLRSWLIPTGYIPQKAAVSTGTIRTNLLYGLSPEQRAQMTDEELLALVRELRIDFHGRLTKGLDTPVGERGVKLSGGEEQRLSIGAAVIKRPRFMLIDEATSNLDSTTEKEVQLGLARALAGNVSALIIAHRLSTVRKICDKFVVLRRASELVDGQPQVEAIAHSFEELARISPTFRQLAEDQELVI